MALGTKLGIIASSGVASFTNTYSLDFDGVDDYIDLSNADDLNFANDFTLSIWVKTSAIGSNQFVIDKSTSASVGNGYSLRVLNTGKVRFWSYSANNSLNSTTTLSADTWYHIAATHDRSGAVNKIYINGALDVTGASGTFNATSNNLRIGTSAVLGNPFSGNLDEASFYDSELSASDILDIYNSGTPTDLTSLSPTPTAWYRMGDNGSYKSPQWLIPNNENKDKVSNYSFDFDGVGDRVSIGTALDFGINSTLSFWIKRGRISTSEVWFGEDSYSSDYLVTITSSTVLYFRINTSYVGWNYAAVKSILNNTTEWVNVCIVRSGNSVELFLNGISYGTGNSNAGTPGATVTRFDTIAASPYGTLNTFAQFDEIAAWNNNTVNPVEIYNGGEPTTLPSGAVAHYKMGEDATFSTNWTVPDQVGSNDGTSANMTIEDRVGDAPSSSNNALSYNMDLVDRVEDVPS